MTFDIHFMDIALRLARSGLGTCAPNPSVGAVLVQGTGDDACIVARGRTMPGGRPHAETQAIERAGTEARGGTLYVTLEPCSHHGQTPPCCEAIIKSGIARVVVAASDPDPRVAGRGIAALQAAGVAVEEGLGREAAVWTNAGHVLRVTQNRPFVQVKMAISADGRIAPGIGQPRWVTGPEARARGHLLRAMSDAIVIGRATLQADDPQLTCRLPGLSQFSPQPVVLDTTASIPSSAALIGAQNGVRPLIACAETASDGERERLNAAGADVVSIVVAGDGSLELPALLSALGERGITRLLVEGGPAVWQSFIAAELVDEVIVFQGPEVLADEGVPALQEPIPEVLADQRGWTFVSRHPVGSDEITVYRRSDPAFM